MAEKTGIQWTESTWTPIRARSKATSAVGWHCEHVSPGCEYCYAESLNKRLGTGLPFKPGLKGGHVELFLDEKMLLAPLRWKKPRMIFVCSMTDAFGGFVPDEVLDKMFAVAALCPQHTLQFLTKRSARMREYFTARHPAGNVLAWQARVCTAIDALIPERTGASRAAKDSVLRGPLPNVWLGVSCEDQENADARIPDLLTTPAAVRFVSAEPLLGSIGFRSYLVCRACGKRAEQCPATDLGDCCGLENRGLVDWIIVGGESGRGARDCRVEWGDATQAQCAAAGVACFRKQLGARPIASDLTGWKAPATLLPDSSGYLLKLKDSKGGDASEWPERMRVREFPKVAA